MAQSHVLADNQLLATMQADAVLMPKNVNNKTAPQKQLQARKAAAPSGPVSDNQRGDDDGALEV